MSIKHEIAPQERPAFQVDHARRCVSLALVAMEALARETADPGISGAAERISSLLCAARDALGDLHNDLRAHRAAL